VSKQWLLIVYDGRGHEAALDRMGCRESKKADQYIAFYSLDGLTLLKRNIKKLKALGLHGIARKVEARPPVRKKPFRINGSDGWAQLPGGGANVLAFKVATAAKLAKDEAEVQRQEQQLADRDAYNRARLAIKRARGEA
jgi:hypothetical protein